MTDKQNLNLNDISKVIENKLSEALPDNISISRADETDETKISKLFMRRERESYMHIDQEFGRFLVNFVNGQSKKDELKHKLKNIFFWLIMTVFLLLAVSPIVTLMFINKVSSITAIIALISNLVELTSAIIVLPKIIAEYLFDKQEDANVIEALPPHSRDFSRELGGFFMGYFGTFVLVFLLFHATYGIIKIC